MFYTIYKTTNLINGKIYIGKHQTKNPNDSYIGSGKILQYAINKYGIENFTKEILFIFDNESDMNDKEAELVTEEFVKEDTNYNLCPGGQGGFGYLNNSYWTPELIRERNIEMNKRSTKPESIRKRVESTDYSELGFSVMDKKILKEFAIKGSKAWKGKKHTEESRRKMSISSSGEKNPMYNKIWIHNDATREIKIVEKTDNIEDGWELGKVFDKKKKISKPKEENIELKIKVKHNKIKRSIWYREKKAKKLYKEYIESGISLRKFAAKKKIVPMTLSNWFREFIKEYSLSKN